MGRDESGIVQAFNRFFQRSEFAGVAHRKKQHRYSSQLCDILVDSPHPRFYQAIEHKSLKTSSSSKLYFSQHFSESDDGHQVDRISDFVDRSGRRGFLAVELKQGRGKELECFFVPWKILEDRFSCSSPGISVGEIRDKGEKLVRESSDYRIEPDLFQ